MTKGGRVGPPGRRGSAGTLPLQPGQFLEWLVVKHLTHPGGINSGSAP